MEIEKIIKKIFSKKGNRKMVGIRFRKTGLLFSRGGGRRGFNEAGLGFLEPGRKKVAATIVSIDY